MNVSTANNQNVGPNIGFKNLRTAMVVLAVVGFMGGLAYISVPFYRYFCQITGFGGTTQRADSAPKMTSAGQMGVRFDANVAGGLPIKFWSDAPPFKAQLNKEYAVNYYVHNLGGEPITITASYNVAPHYAGPYFSKIECFCFQEQQLAPGQIAKLPVKFFVAETIQSDNMHKLEDEITLSYTFFQKPKG